MNTEELIAALNDAEHPYHGLALTLCAGFNDACLGKGKDRHADELPFEEQSLFFSNRFVGSADGALYQVLKKCKEARKFDAAKEQSELAGAMVYLAAYTMLRREFNPTII